MVALRAHAVVARYCVLAEGVRTARPFERLALVEIDASFERIAGVVFLAGTSIAA